MTRKKSSKKAEEAAEATPVTPPKKVKTTKVIRPKPVLPFDADTEENVSTSADVETADTSVEDMAAEPTETEPTPDVSAADKADGPGVGDVDAVDSEIDDGDANDEAVSADAETVAVESPSDDESEVAVVDEVVVAANGEGEPKPVLTTAEQYEELPAAEADAVVAATRGRWDEIAEAAIPVANAASLISGLVLVTDANVYGRPWLALILTVFGPGSGIVLALGRFDTAVRWVLTIALSLACFLLVSELLLTIGQLRTAWGAAVLTILTATGVIARLSRPAPRDLA